MAQKTVIIAAAVLGLALGAAGCNRQESSSEVREDVAEAQQDANEEVAEQQSEAVASTDTGSVEDRAEADYDVAIAKADGDRKVAEEACEALSGDAQENCKKQAETQYDSAKAQAQAELDATRSGTGMTGVTTPPATDSAGSAATTDDTPRN
jgi:hypothetical protein